MSKYQFVNPYNFVPLEKNGPQRTKVEKGTYSGVIEYSLLTKTPLFIPNTSSDDAFKMNVTDHKSYDFFSYRDLSGERESVRNRVPVPVIPGSSIRGVLRSNYEVLTNSCMSAIDDEDVLSKRTNETFKPGLLEKVGDDFVLHNAEDCLLRTRGENDLTDDLNWGDDPSHNNKKCYRQKNLREGQKVYFKCVARERGKSLAQQVSVDKGNGKTEGYVLKGEDGPNMGGRKQQKHACHIFKLSNSVLKPGYKATKLTATDIGTLDKVLRSYKDNKKNTYQEYAEEWRKFRKSKDKTYFPVYYSRIQGSKQDDQTDFVMLSPACITREIYHNKLSRMIPNHRSCESAENLCPACRLFGMLGRGTQVTSRVRMTDLCLCEQDEKRMQENAGQLFDQPITLGVLNSPKINNMEFYMKRPKDAWFWTYDYYITAEGKLTPNVPMINGRKFYWHQMKTQTDRQEPDNLNTTIRPLKKDITFCGKIYFDGLSKKELDELCYLIETGDKDPLKTKKHGYKLGHAKPFGYGSVALHLDKVILKRIIPDEEKKSICYLETDYMERETPCFDQNTKTDFEKYTDFELLKDENVHYPKPSKADKDGKYPVFGWFVENHAGFDRNKKSDVRMPNSRQQMVYKEYMEAMEPGLKKTGIPNTASNFKPAKTMNMRPQKPKRW